MSDRAKIADYRDALAACVTAARLLTLHDLPSILEAIDHADAVGPIIDPTLWMQKEGAMHQDREVLEAAMPLWRLAQKLLEQTDRGTAA